MPSLSENIMDTSKKKILIRAPIQPSNSASPHLPQRAQKHDVRKRYLHPIFKSQLAQRLSPPGTQLALFRGQGVLEIELGSGAGKADMLASNSLFAPF